MSISQVTGQTSKTLPPPGPLLMIIVIVIVGFNYVYLSATYGLWLVPGLANMNPKFPAESTKPTSIQRVNCDE